MVKVKYMNIATISIKGQITIPKALQLKLQLKPKSKVVLMVEDNVVVMKPLETSIVEETAGSLTQYVSQDKKNKDFDFIMKETKKKVSSNLAKNT